MVEPGILIVTVANPATGLAEEDLETLFYGDGEPETDEDAKHRLISWEVQDNETEMSTFSFTLENGDLALFDVDLLQKGNVVTLQFGDSEALSDKFDGVITARRGWRKLTISGQLGGEVRLANKVASQKWKNLKISDVAKILFADAGLKAVVEDTGIVHKHITKTKTTAYKFLKKKVHELGGAWVCYVEGDTGYFVQKNFKKTPIGRLRFAREVDDEDYVTLKEPEFEEDQQNLPVETTAVGFDLGEKEFMAEKGNNENSDQTSLGEGTYFFDGAAGVLAYKPPAAAKTAETGKVVHSPKQTTDALAATAKGDFARRNAKQCGLRWSVLGDVGLRSKNNLTIECDSKRLSGNWYIENVRHFCTGGPFTTELALIRNALSTSPLTSGAAAATPSAAINDKEPEPGAKTEVAYVLSPTTGKLVPKGQP